LIRDRIKVAANLTLPDADHRPAFGLKLVRHLAVALHISAELRDPAISVGRTELGLHRIKPSTRPAFRISVPEVAIDEYRDSLRAVDDVGSSRYLVRMHSKAETSPMESFPQGQLGTRVAATDSGHDPGRGCRVPGDGAPLRGRR